MREVFAFIGVIVLVVAVGFGLTALGLLGDRHFQPYAEETRSQTYDSSRTYQQGMAVDLDDLCRRYHTAKDVDIKAGLADTIRLRSARYSGPLPAHVEACLGEVR